MHISGVKSWSFIFILFQDCKSIDLPIAISIVMSGQYEDDVDNLEDVVYTGQGGNNLLGNKQQIRDQVLERGNLALKVLFLSQFIV